MVYSVFQKILIIDIMSYYGDDNILRMTATTTMKTIAK
jgi:hypothetical protein